MTEAKDKLGLRRTVSLMAKVWVRSAREAPGATALTLLEAIGKITGALQPLCYGWMVTALVSQEPRWFVLGAVVLVSSASLNHILQMTGTTARVRQRERIGHSYDLEIAELSARIATVDHLEAPAYLDKLQALRDNHIALGDSLNGTINFLNNMAWALASVWVAASADPRMLLLIVAGIPPLLLQPLQQRWNKRSEEAEAAPSRLTRSLVSTTSQVEAGAEIRIFGLREVLGRRIAEAAHRWRTPSTRLATREAIVQTSAGVFYFVAAAAVVGWILVDTLAGRVTPGAFTTAVASLAAMQRFVAVLVFWIGHLGRSIRAVDRYQWLVDHARAVAEQADQVADVPTQISDGISLRGVAFRYPGAEVDALAGLDLDLPAGAVVAVVGENGAGKSTLVKLLAGLYRATTGTIRVDGIDLSRFDTRAWRQTLSGAYQDHVRLELAVQEAVGSGDLARLEESDAVATALVRAGAESDRNLWPYELNTQLGTDWTGGVDLSGGQWQRIALARGMMRRRPLLVMLDEPTSALDAAAENDLFARHAEMARAAGSGGGITLLVTHRFSTVAAADLVVVLDGGKVSEVGTHAELMAAGRTYAELYRIQAVGYRT